MGRTTKDKAILGLGFISILFIGLWSYEFYSNRQLKAMAAAEQQMTVQKIIRSVEKDLQEVSDNFDHYRSFGRTVLDSTTWYTQYGSPMITEYGTSIQATTTALNYVLPYVPVIGPVLSDFTDKIDKGVEQALVYSKKFNAYIALIGETNKTMDEIQEIQKKFKETKDLKYLYQLKTVMDDDFRKKMKKTNEAALELESAIISVEQFMNVSLLSATLIEKSIDDWQESGEEPTEEAEQAFFSSVKNAINSRIEGSASEVLHSTKGTLNESISLLRTNIQLIKTKTEPYRVQIKDYTTRIHHDFERIGRISAAIQIIQLLEKPEE